MQLIRVGAQQEGRWDQYVEPRTTTVTDLAAWRHVVRCAYGMPSHFLAVEDAGRFVGVLGLFEVKHRLFGHYLTTAVFGNDGGLYYDHGEALELLLGEAKRLADDRGVEYLVIRNRELDLPDFSVDRHYRTAAIDLTDGADSVWKNTLPGNTRNQIRRGLKEGFTIEMGHDQLRAFHHVFNLHMRDLGSPAHSVRYYESIVENLGDRAQFVVVRDGHELAAGALLLEANGTAMNYHTVALRKYNRRCPNYLIYWKMIERSCERGNRSFDMGRSEDESPTLEFKKNWNPQVDTLSYNYYLRRSQEIPYLDPRNPKFRLAIAAWKRLPLWLCKALGPRLIRGLA